MRGCVNSQTARGRKEAEGFTQPLTEKYAIQSTLPPDPCNCAGFFNCTEAAGGDCGVSGNVLSTRLAFGALSAVAVAPDGTVHVADNGQARILAIRLVETPFNVYGAMAVCIVAFFFLFDRFRCLSRKCGDNRDTVGEVRKESSFCQISNNQFMDCSLSSRGEGTEKEN